MKIPKDKSLEQSSYRTGVIEKSSPHPQKDQLFVTPSLDILVVDSDPMSLTCNRLLLEGAGHRVTAVNSGELALEYTQIRSYDLAFMELTLPKLSGEQTAQLLRDPVGEAISPDLIIIALTSKTDREAQQRCQQAGMDDFLPKPTTVEELQRAIKTALAQRNGTQAA